MTPRELRALRRSIWRGCREAVRDLLVSRDPQVVADAWGDWREREWSGPEIPRECRRIAAAATAALRQAEREGEP